MGSNSGLDTVSFDSNNHAFFFPKKNDIMVNLSMLSCRECSFCWLEEKDVYDLALHAGFTVKLLKTF